MPIDSGYAQWEHLKFMDELYGTYGKDPMSVPASWRCFFDGVELGLSGSSHQDSVGEKALCVHRLIQAYREHGHLLANINPLSSQKEVRELDVKEFGFSRFGKEELFPSLGILEEKEVSLDKIVTRLQKIYAGSIGFEYMACQNRELQAFIQEKIEKKRDFFLSREQKKALLKSLMEVESFEAYLNAKYVGQTRFSIEGLDVMVPLMTQLLESASREGVEDLVLGMAHRGRLSILKHIFQKPLKEILFEFEDDQVLSVFGNDDVKYHMGCFSEWHSSLNQKLSIHMASNPSHLESVNPVVLGEVFAKQFFEYGGQKEKVLPFLIHGDAAMTGQGVMYESMQLMHLQGYSVGGTLHLVANNQIGYTASVSQGRSTRYCTDIAKTFQIPVFHVNAEDPESVLFVADLALSIRKKFQLDVFVDLIGYRKHGHNEGDEPSFTQPKEYGIIRSKKKPSEIYAEMLLSEGVITQEEMESLSKSSQQELSEVKEKKSSLLHKREIKKEKISTQVEREKLQRILDQFCSVPEGFSLHPKLQKWLEMRKRLLEGPVDWSSAEMLSFASLLEEGIPIRLAGQDSERGTFAQRHLMWIDHKTGEKFCPLGFLKTPFQLINSPLSEFAGMAFEYGYSTASQNGLTLWEAQYGDFNNGAQILIDQYLVSGEKKWNRKSSLVLLLPHGYEGQGPEHSSARLERFLQLSSENNLRIVYPSTPSQYFHLLRRQAKEEEKKPLIILTPKGLLRSKENTSRSEDLTQGEFHPILEDPKPLSNVRRLLFCSGKVFYDLSGARKQDNVAIIRIEELYPLPLSSLRKMQEKYKEAKEVFWVQEEPQNMGAWSYIAPFLQEIFLEIKYVGREANATTATGSSKKHKQEQALLVEEALKGL